MMIVSKMIVAGAVICVTLLPATSEGIDSILGVPTSPIRTNPQRKAGSAGEQARSAAARALGRDGAVSSSPIEFEDDHPFGEEGGRHSAWLLTDSVAVDQPDHEIAIHVVVNEAGRLLAAYTAPKSEWIQPVGSPRDPESEARLFWWRVSSLPANELRMTIGDVLDVLRLKLGFDPSGPGQIVIRPRRVSSPTPATVADGVVVPKYPEGPAWIVEILGTRFDEDETFYWSGALALIDDRTGDLIKYIYLP